MPNLIRHLWILKQVQNDETASESRKRTVMPNLIRHLIKILKQVQNDEELIQNDDKPVQNDDITYFVTYLGSAHPAGP